MGSSIKGIRMSVARYRLNGNHRATLSYFNGIEIGSDFEHIYYNRRISESKSHYYRGSIFNFNQIISKNPGFVEAYLKRGCAKYEIGDQTGAMADFNKALEINSCSANAFSLRGFVKGRLSIENVHGAIADFDRAIDENPGYAEAYFNRGETKLLLGYPASAIHDLTTAADLLPGNAKVLLSRGIARYMIGDKDGALSDWLDIAESGDPDVNEIIEKYS